VFSQAAPWLWFKSLCIVFVKKHSFVWYFPRVRIQCISNFIEKMQHHYPVYWPQFYTATILKWLPLLEDDNCKQIIMESIHFLVKQKRARIYAFVIMKNHLHFIWQPLPPYSLSKLQLVFMKFTAQKIKAYYLKNAPELIEACRVNLPSRKYQVWKRDALSIELFTPAVFDQKMDYIHQNPVKAGICVLPEEYLYSSALFYHCGIDSFQVLTQ